jgi:hypothetical protein
MTFAAELTLTLGAMLLAALIVADALERHAKRKADADWQDRYFTQINLDRRKRNARGQFKPANYGTFTISSHDHN